MLNARAANIRCDRYYSKFLEIEVELNRLKLLLIGSPGAPCRQQLPSLSALDLVVWAAARRGAYVRVRSSTETTKAESTLSGHSTDAWVDPPAGPAGYIGLGRA